MTLQGLSIKNLFGQFDYEISLVNRDGIIILTGPNGYGKTTVLNIINSLFSGDFRYFQALNFENIIFHFSDNKTIGITKRKPEIVNQRIIQVINGQQHITTQQKEFSVICLELQFGNQTVDKYEYTQKEDSKLLQHLDIVNNLPFADIAGINIPGFQIGIDIDDLRHQIQKNSINILLKNPQNNNQHLDICNLLTSLNIYLIKDQRLMQESVLVEQLNKPKAIKTSFTIHNMAKDLKETIAAKQMEAFQTSQQLDSTFPKRILEQKIKMTQEDFLQRMKILSDKQDKLKKFGITLSTQVETEYDTAKAEVFTVYLEDSEKKVSVFDELIDKIEFFVSTLNKKHLANKNIVINAKNGFYMQAVNNTTLNLSLLSSGEQQEIVLLYELLFKTEPNTLILIDEPEISLHVVWQKEFVKDLLEIAKIKKISFCLATHSPQIINGRWDLVTDLYTLVNKKENPDFEEDNAK